MPNRTAPEGGETGPLAMTGAPGDGGETGPFNTGAGGAGGEAGPFNTGAGGAGGEAGPFNTGAGGTGGEAGPFNAEAGVASVPKPLFINISPEFSNPRKSRYGTMKSPHRLVNAGL